ncbi:SDR family NAD(P)-dependent oxidoreductase [Actinoplanes sp. L3-i22]|uniref:SDR family NAD(P)-dependent oxidoreductase n=1 Tax=Actinoplanes sp. L3-i22 TaxID=2836373 RepID=UPI001C75E8DE|nr:SDR family NAD(P)-dependent oxidoreductase [Actinoplanes sp. L3-i22]BCY09224.1 short-chain dehydrogenase [Actinoplanes sp. L3-i22]
MPKTIIITGASDGIGAAAARRLHADGHTVVVVGRSPQKTRAVADELGAAHFLVDYTRFDDVRRLAGELLDACPRIDVLVNNAGGVFGDPARTVDGFEKTLQVNHLSPFLLTNLLLERLLAGRASVIQTSSVGSKLFGHLDLDDLNNDRNFSPNKAYGDAKLMNILFTRELHERFHDRGLSAAAFHPGLIATSFASDTTSAMRFVYGSGLRRLFMGSPEKGAEQLVWLATTTAGQDWRSGEYYERGKPAKRPNPQVKDLQLAARLWERSAAMVGMATV